MKKYYIKVGLQKVFCMTNPWFDKILRDGDIFYLHFMKSEKNCSSTFQPIIILPCQPFYWTFDFVNIVKKIALRFTHLCARTGTETRNWKHLLMALFLFCRQIPLAWSSYNPLPIYKSHSFTNKQGKCNYSDNFSSTYILNWLLV